MGLKMELRVKETKEGFIKCIIKRITGEGSRITFTTNDLDIIKSLNDEDFEYILKRIYKDKNINNVYIKKVNRYRSGKPAIVAERIEKIDHNFLFDWEDHIEDFPNDSYGVLDCCDKWNYIQNVIGNKEDIIDLQNEFMIYKLMGGKLSWNL